MAKPIVAALGPQDVQLEKGKEYYFCRCGRSKNQPFCDGSHEGTGIEPLAFTARGVGEAWLCRCKQSKDFPYCEGSHAQVPESALGQEFDGSGEDTKVESMIYSGEGGMLPEEQAENSRYLFELGPARYGYSEDILDKIQAFHFKGGQGAKTGIGGVLPGAWIRRKAANGWPGSWVRPWS